jgi:hypothetical protein
LTFSKTGWDIIFIYPGGAKEDGYLACNLQKKGYEKSVEILPYFYVTWQLTLKFIE